MAHGEVSGLRYFGLAAQAARASTETLPAGTAGPRGAAS